MTLVGRTLDGPGILIRETSVSRHHAHLAFERGEWHIRDLGSTNRTFVNDASVTSGIVRHGDRIAFGSVGFYLAVRTHVAPPVISEAVITEVRAHSAYEDSGDHAVAAVYRGTDAGLPVVPIRITEIGRGAGGILEVAEVTVQLSVNQTRLISLLAQRMLEEEQQPAAVRGFVRTAELVAGLQWATPGPHDNRVKQLVRRTRRQLVRAGCGDLIEARQRYGYRLRLIPTKYPGDSGSI